MSYRVTIACPESLVKDANELAKVLGFTEADGSTYQEIWYLDSKGNRYACPSMIVSAGFATKAFSSLKRPNWDKDTKVDLSAAERAQSLVRVSTQENPLMADPDFIVAVFSDPLLANVDKVREYLGLTLEEVVEVKDGQ